MAYFTVKYQGNNLDIALDSDEVQVTRLKNHILPKFKSDVKFQDLNILLVQNNTEYLLDNNEVIDSDLDLVLEVNSS